LKLFKILLCLLFLLILQPSFSQNSYQKTGLASYYADKFAGRRTSSGEIFSQKKMTCAHKTLPLGTKIKVTNLSNDKSVVLTVNDRGPFHDTRMLDVTRAAAKKLDFLDAGETEVSIEILNNEGKSEEPVITTDSLSPFFKMEALEEGIRGYSVKVASYLSEEKTLETVKDLKQKTGLEIFVQPVWHKKHFMYRIYAGQFESKEKAENLKNKLTEFYSDCYVTELRPTSAERNFTDNK